VAGGARLELANNIAIGSEPLFLNGTGGGNGALRSVSGNNSWSGGIALDSAAEIQVDADSLTIGGGISGSTAGLTFDGNGTATVNGAIGSGVTTLTKTSGGTLILANGNAFTGEASVSGGVLRMTHGSALGSTAAGTTVTSGARLEFQGDLSNSGEALTLNGTGGGNGALRHIAGNTTWNGGILLGSTAEIQSDAGTLTLGGGINAGSQGLTIDGVGGVQVQTSGISGSGATLTKSGLGTLTLAAGGTFGGTATVSAGTVVIGADAALGSTAAGTTVQPGAMVQMNGGVDYTSPEPLTLAGSGIGAIGALNLRSGISRFAGPITLAANTTIGAANGAQLTVDNSIGGGFALSKAGLGTVVLTGVNPYSGDTTVEAGTLALTGSGSLGTGSAIRVDAGAVLDASGRADGRLTVGAAQTLSGSGQVIGRVVLNGSVAPGASVGSLVTGTESWNPAGSYQWEIQDAVGGAGVGWDLVAINGDLEINASVGDPFRVGLRTLGGPALNFDYNTPYQWTMASVSGVTLGFDAAKFAIDSTGFQNDTAGGAFSLSSGSVKVVFTPNLSPLAQNASYYRRTNTTLKIKIPVLLESYTSDPDGDARDLQWFSPVSDNGVAIVQRGDYLFYETDQNKNDAFRYRVRDVRTSYRPWDTVRTAQNTIKIQMLDDNNASPNIISMRVVDETAELTIAAIPNFSYAIQRTTDLTPPIHWDYIGSQTAPPRGVFVFVDANPPFPPSMAYYRTVEE
jgi:autotransporter-associated beta strand protein